ncbi:hypothetical protein EHO57_17460 [Leptospira langatensis]|uniref:Uncharacterized protein n=1 Tax=Leptospira langatensis TaxID=2484983 RepID=A0A5R2AR21_9LEPT|nr:hypothetical protein EHO57_17460 [Leptospira langatensis]
MFFRSLFAILFLFSNCILVGVEGRLQTNLISRSEAKDRISGVSDLRFSVCLNQSIVSDFIETTDYTNYLTCEGKCSDSTYYRKNDIDALYRAILVLPCDPNASLLIPVIAPFKADEFQGKYIGF